jgi:hypothetical protein
MQPREVAQSLLSEYAVRATTVAWLLCAKSDSLVDTAAMGDDAEALVRAVDDLERVSVHR